MGESMRTQIASTSIDAYRSLGPKLGHQQAIIVAYISRNCHRDFTRCELAEATGLRLSSVCGRVAELLKAQTIVEGVRRPCRVTGVSAHPLRLASPLFELDAA